MVLGWIVAFVFVILLSGMLAGYLTRCQAPHNLWRLAFSAFSLRIGYVFFDSIIGLYSGGGDESGYEATIWFVAQQWQSGALFAPLQYGLAPGNTGDYMFLYTAIFSPAYAFFGRIQLLPRLQMALIGSFVVVNVYLTANLLWDHQAGMIAGGITAIFPYWVVLSSILYRDMLIIFFLSAVVYFTVRWQSGEHTRRLLLLVVVTTVSAVSLRLQNLFVIGALFATAALLFIGRDVRGLVTSTAVGILFVGLMYARFGKEILLNELAGRRSWLARSAPGSYLTGLTYESLYELFVFAPIGALHFALVPFPWHVVNLLSTIAFLQNLVLWYPVVVCALFGFRDVFTRQRGSELVLPLIAFSLAGLFGYGLVEGNVGPAMRHRSQFQFIFFILAGVGVSRRLSVKLSDRCMTSSDKIRNI